MRNLTDDIVNIQHQIGDSGTPGSVRGRLHMLEQYNAAAKAADAARSAAMTAQAAVATARDRRFTMAIAFANLVVVFAGVLIAAALHH